MVSDDHSFTPSGTYVIEDLRALKAVTNVLRFDILSYLIQREGTVKEIAESLGVEPANLYYHVRELEGVGLIRTVRTRQVNGIQQKYFRAVAQFYRLSTSFFVEQETGELDQAGVEFIAATVDYSLAHLRRALTSGIPEHLTEAFAVSRRIAHVSAERAIEFRRRLRELEEEFAAIDQPDEDLTFEFLIALFPHAPGSRT